MAKPAPRRKYTDEQREEALKLYETHGPTEVQRQLGIPKGTLGRWVKAAGVRTVRSQNAHEATQAAQADAKALRAELSLGLLQDAKRMRDELWEPSIAISAGQVVEAPRAVPEVQLKTLTGIGIAIDKSATLEAVDNDGGVAEVVSILDSVREELEGRRA